MYLAVCFAPQRQAISRRTFHCSHSDSAPSAAGAETDDGDDDPAKFSSDIDWGRTTMMNHPRNHRRSRVGQLWLNRVATIAHGDWWFTIDDNLIVWELNLLFWKIHHWHVELQNLILDPSAGKLDQIQVQPESLGMWIYSCLLLLLCQKEGFQTKIAKLRGALLQPEIRAAQLKMLLSRDTNKCYDKEITGYCTLASTKTWNKLVNKYKDKLINKHENKRIDKYKNQVHQQVHPSTVTSGAALAPLPQHPHAVLQRLHTSSHAALTPLPRRPQRCCNAASTPHPHRRHVTEMPPSRRSRSYRAALTPLPRRPNASFTSTPPGGLPHTAATQPQRRRNAAATPLHCRSYAALTLPRRGAPLNAALTRPSRRSNACWMPPSRRPIMASPPQRRPHTAAARSSHAALKPPSHRCMPLQTVPTPLPTPHPPLCLAHRSHTAATPPQRRPRPPAPPSRSGKQPSRRSHAAARCPHAILIAHISRPVLPLPTIFFRVGGGGPAWARWGWSGGQGGAGFGGLAQLRGGWLVRVGQAGRVVGWAGMAGW